MQRDGAVFAGFATHLDLTPADPDKFVEIVQIDVSYSGVPSGGSGLMITDAGVAVQQTDARVTGMQEIHQWLKPRTSRTKGATVVVTLMAGGIGGMIGKLNVHAYARL